MTLLRELAEAPNNRLDIIAKLVELSYDAVDVLRKAEAVEEEEEPEQWLSLRYWASEVLGVIRRSAAVATWERIAEEEEEEESLVEGVAAFSAFHGAYPPEEEERVGELARTVDHLLDDSIPQGPKVAYEIWDLMGHLHLHRSSSPFLDAILQEQRIGVLLSDDPEEQTTPVSAPSDQYASVAIIAVLKNSSTKHNIRSCTIILSPREAIIAVAPADAESADAWIYCHRTPAAGGLSRRQLEECLAVVEGGTFASLEPASTKDVVATAALQLLLHYVEALRDRVTNQYAAAAALFLFSPSIASDQQLCALCFRAARQYFPYDILFLEPIFFPRLPPAARVEAEEICSKLRRAGREVVVHRRGGAEGGPELRDHVEGGHGRPDFDWNSDDQPPGAARDWEVLPQGGAREAGAEREVGGDVPR